MTDDELSAALAAFRQSSHVAEPIPDWAAPEDAAFMTDRVLRWWRGRMGDGPWCWDCARTATLRRVSGGELEACYCEKCCGVGVYVPVEMADDGSWRAAVGIPEPADG